MTISAVSRAGDSGLSFIWHSYQQSWNVSSAFLIMFSFVLVMGHLFFIAPCILLNLTLSLIQMGEVGCTSLYALSHSLK